MGAFLTVHRRAGLWLSALIGIAGFIALSEVDRLLLRTTDGALSLSAAQAPGGVFQSDRQQWSGWSSGAATIVERLTAWYVGLDAVFTIGYVTALLLGSSFIAHPIVRRAVRACIVAAIAGEAVESIAVLALVHDAPEMVQWLLRIGSAVKWLSLLIAAVLVVASPQVRRQLTVAVRVLWTGLWVQRLSVFVVLVAAVAGVVSAAGPLDQFPDAQRRWLDDLGSGDHLWSLLAGGVAAAVVAGSLYVVGTARANRVRRRYTDLDSGGLRRARPPALLLPWTVVPLALVSGMRFLDWRGHENLVDVRTLVNTGTVLVVIVAASASARLATFDPKLRTPLWPVIDAVISLIACLAFLGLAGMPGWAAAWVVVAIISGFVIATLMRRRASPIVSAAMPTMPSVSANERIVVAQWVARAMSMLFLAVCAWGGVRSFTAPVILTLATSGGVSVDWAQGAVLTASWLALVVVGAVASWWVPRPSRFDASSLRISSCLTGLVVIVGLGMLGSFVFWPLPLSGVFGVVGTTTMVIGLIAALLGCVVVGLQDREPLDIFGALQFTGTPVLTICLVIAVLAAAGGGPPRLHRIAFTEVTDATERLDLQETFQQWLDRSKACDRQVNGVDRPVRPMIMVAASGGGIRSAVWTANSLATISAADSEGNRIDPCGQVAVFASVGVSGGSVGLALARATSPDVQWKPADLRRDVANVSNPDALAAGISGLLVSDALASATGIRVQWVNGQIGWRDRAALMEQRWIRAVPKLSDDFDWTNARGPTGALIFNAASVSGPCRLLVGQVQFAAQSSGINCDGQEGVPARSMDFASVFGKCLPVTSWATTAMLSARFPYVTPSGRVQVNQPPAGAPGYCADNSLQIIDGGYVEGEGLGTIADMSAQVAELVREQNAKPGGPIVVPVVVYLNDEPKPPTRLGSNPPSPEALVPPSSNNPGSMAWPDASIDRINAAFDAVCPPVKDGGCGSAREQLFGGSWPIGVRKGSVVTSAPPIGPSVELPLGWTLSRASISFLQTASGQTLCGQQSVAANPQQTSTALAGLRTLICVHP
ncbi:MAG: hypothetical protein WBA38_07725 [Gordonia sp. (in: high G+C Gram-positive bacteria)]|uniref:hypothetical protein n=1 Tax=Gordonia sp. (in: high G+C Gram-positive bacteria) TaxID=84139 RepID=UPI003C7197FB